MKTCMIAAAVWLALAGMTQADEVLIRKQRSGKQVVTTLEIIKAPPVGDKAGGPDGPMVTGVVLKAFDWSCGKHFTDEQGRRWHLARGASLADKPNVVNGWLLVAKDGRTSFHTVSGRQFVMD